MLSRVANSGRWTKAGILLMLAIFVAGFVALSWPTEAQEVRYRPRNLLERVFGSRDYGGGVEQQRPRRVARRGILQRLFGREEVQPEPKRRVIVRTKTKKARNSAGQAAVVRVEEPEALPKLDTARTVMVVGDFMASGLSEGLAGAYSQNRTSRSSTAATARPGSCATSSTTGQARSRR